MTAQRRAARPLVVSAVSLLAAGTLALTGCVGTAPTPTFSPRPTPSTTPTINVLEPGPLQPVGEPTTVLSGLAAPWSIVRLDSGSALISERDTARIIELPPGGAARVVTIVKGVAPSGEGGLLGLAARHIDETTYLYAYYTSATDNRIVRMPLLGDPGALRLGPQEHVLTGIAKASNHNGGRLGFGPDGKLYATVGDAGSTGNAQNLDSLNGKILRLEPDGSVPADNPFPGSLVYSLGHRNPQGIAWDSSGQLWASEFGQNTWDEFNRIEAGKNYGWPTVEGIGGKEGFVDPVLQWATSEASPSGLAFERDTFFMAALRGQRLWAIYTGDSPHATPWFVGEFGRMRDAVPGPGGTLWVLTNNTDGRGTPREGDDRLLEIQLEPLHEG